MSDYRKGDVVCVAWDGGLVVGEVSSVGSGVEACYGISAIAGEAASCGDLLEGVGEEGVCGLLVRDGAAVQGEEVPGMPRFTSIHSDADGRELWLFDGDEDDFGVYFHSLVGDFFERKGGFDPESKDHVRIRRVIASRVADFVTSGGCVLVFPGPDRMLKQISDYVHGGH